MLRPERQVSLSRASLVPCRAKPYDARAMARVRGDGGIFFKSKNPEALRAWYAKHLGIVSEGDQGTLRLPSPKRRGILWRYKQLLARLQRWFLLHGRA